MEINLWQVTHIGNNRVWLTDGQFSWQMKVINKEDI
jgi:hypothetical protein